MEERRKYVRIPENTQVQYEVIPDYKKAESPTKDISQGGIRFKVREFIPGGSNLKIRLTLHNIPFSFEAIVRLVWVRELAAYKGGGYEAGVMFVDIPPEAVKHLIGYIKAFTKLEAE